MIDRASVKLEYRILTRRLTHAKPKKSNTIRERERH
jgi:hypothetical protein